ncbi:MAG TPA: carboxymuconolactone decarboxylase family protein [Candidatus Obscuribacterales bacterium]
MSRLPELTRQQVEAEYQSVWDRIAGTRGGVWGPYQVLMHVPPLADRVAALGEFIRFSGSLPGYVRELAILAAAREAGSPYEWAIHEPCARAEGVTQAAIEAVRTGAAADVLPVEQRIAVLAVRSLYRNQSLPQDLFDELVRTFGNERTIELVTLAGFYGLLAFILNGFGVGLPDDAKPAF